MTAGGKNRTRTRRVIAQSSEDQELWDYATRDLEPLKAKPRVGTIEPSPGARIRQHTAKQAPAATAEQPHTERPRRPAKPVERPPLMADFDPRLARKLASGRRTIDARIDLHGMRKAQAHLALRKFLLRCHADGLSFVLVITGKGGAVTREEDDIGFASERARGVLRNMVPGWLAEPELRPVVVSHRTASRQHGGEGALYVQLRRRRS